MKLLLFVLPLIGAVIVGINKIELEICLNNLLTQKQDVEITVHAWKKRSDNTSQIYEFIHGNETLARSILPPVYYRILYVLFHDIAGNGLESWIIKSQEHLMKPVYMHLFLTVMSIDYKNFVLEKNQALNNVEGLGNRTAVLLDWALQMMQMNTFSQAAFVGFGIGALIAGKTAEAMVKLSNNTRKPVVLLALDPFVADEGILRLLPTCFQFPEIKNSVDYRVIAMHTSTCSHYPTIPACDQNSGMTIGFADTYSFDGAVQPGCQNVECSHKRAVDLYLEKISEAFGTEHGLISWQCPNYTEFQRGACPQCSGCPVTTAMEYPNKPGRYYLYTNAFPPYGRGNNATRP